MLSRKVKVLDVSNKLLCGWFTSLLNVPDDIRVRDVEYDAFSDTVKFLLESKDFEELPECAIPVTMSIYGEEPDDAVTFNIGNWRITKFQDSNGHRNYFRALYKGIEIDNVIGFEWQTGVGKIPTIKIETREMNT